MKTTKAQSELTAEIAELKERLRQPEVVAPEVFVTDTTPEALGTALTQQGERAAILSDEGNIFEILSGMYSGGRQNLDVFLKGHAGGPVRVRRQGRTYNLNKIAVTIGLAIQPEVIEGLDEKAARGFRGKGLFARPLPYLPKSNIGHRDIRDRKPIPANAEAEYRKGIRALLNVPTIRDAHGVETSRMVTLTPEAKVSSEKFAMWIESRQGDGKPFRSIQDFTSKLPGAALRIAGLCQVAEEATTLSEKSTLSIAKERMEKAQDLCEKLIAHIYKFIGLLGDNPTISDAKYSLDWILNNAEPDSKNEHAAKAAAGFRQDGNRTGWFFKQNELHMSSRFKNSKLERVLNAIAILQERNILSVQYRLQTRKPTLIYWVNPAVMGVVQ